ncbi:MAG: DUF4160 domain-containing protein [SAR324 cluster bacterium]|nr:DUF4160 domain-containing protein [SAR324 cluster bacterium]
MPTVRRISGPYRFFFYSFDCYEPMHVHAQRDRAVCKFWLNPLVLSKSNGFSPKDLNAIRKTIQSNMTIIMEAWYEHCG